MHGQSYTLDSVVTEAERRALKKLSAFLDSMSHPLHSVVSNQRSLFSDSNCGFQGVTHTWFLGPSICTSLQ